MKKLSSSKSLSLSRVDWWDQSNGVWFDVSSVHQVLAQTEEKRNSDAYNVVSNCTVECAQECWLHNAIHMCNFVTRHWVTVLDHPPYSLDLVQTDFFFVSLP